MGGSRKGKCVGVAQHGTSGGYFLQLEDCVRASARQTFDFHERGQGVVRWAQRTDLCLTVAGGESGHVAAIHLTNCTGADSQHFARSGANRGSAFIGANLGGWLVCEDWMWRDTMEKQGITDEWSLIQKNGGPSDPRAEEVLRDHWEDFLRPEHLDMLKRFGVTHVRIPFGWWMFPEVYDVRDGFVGGQEPYLARAITWLRQRNMQAVLDLHAMPGAQARWDGFTGRRADPMFFRNQTHYSRGKRAVDALVQLVLRYEANASTSGVVMGVQFLNEPTHSFWDTKPGIRTFYEEMVPRVRKHLPADRYMIMLSFMESPQVHTAEWLSRKRREDPKNYAGVAYDKHLYHSFGDNQAPWTPEVDMCKTCCRDSHILEPMWSQDVPIVIGEYSLSTGFAGWNAGDFLRTNFENQLSLFNTTRGLVGSFAWNYRIVVEANSEMYMEWSLVDLIQSGHVPRDGGYRFQVHDLCPALGPDYLDRCPKFSDAALWNENCIFQALPAGDRGALGNTSAATTAGRAEAAAGPAPKRLLRR